MAPAAAANADSTSPSQVDAAVIVTNTSRSTSWIQATPQACSHSAWAPGTERSHRQTTDSGHPLSWAIHRYPAPRALTSSAMPITAMVSTRRESTNPSSSTRVGPRTPHTEPGRVAGSASPIHGHGPGGSARTPEPQHPAAPRASQHAGAQVRVDPRHIHNRDHRFVVWPHRTSVVSHTPRWQGPTRVVSPAPLSCPVSWPGPPPRRGMPTTRWPIPQHCWSVPTAPWGPGTRPRMW
jgi:hypothetical protein